MDGSLQLFGRAPMAAFTSEAAQNRKREKGDRGGGPASLFSNLVCFFLTILFLLFCLSFAFSFMNLLQCDVLKASYCSVPNNAL